MSTTQQETLSIDGMHCEHCVEAVREALSALDGVTVDAVEVGRATISHDGSLRRDHLAAALDDAGYELAA
jgi:copper chaperone